MKACLVASIVATCACSTTAFTPCLNSAGAYGSALRTTSHHTFCSPAGSTRSSRGGITSSDGLGGRRPKDVLGKSYVSTRRNTAVASLSMFDATDLFQLQQWAGDISATELTHVSPVTIGVMYGTGLLMSLSPCALSLLPLTISYIAGSEAEGVAEGAAASAGGGGGGGQGGFDSVKSGFVPSAAFAAGLATVLSFLGLSATFAGRVMGSSAAGSEIGETLLPLGASVFAVTMGLNVLELVEFDLPSFDGGLEFMTSLPRNARAYLLGASSALVASPCCTPVLASILGFIASSQDPLLGLVLLLTYSAGYTTPLMAAGTASGVLSRLMSARGFNWISPASGALLISYGTYNGLNAIFGAA